MTTTKPAAKSKAARGRSAAPAVRSRLNKKDKTTAFLMAAIPTILVVALVWYPAFGSVVLSFTDWNGIGPLTDIKFIGLKNYQTSSPSTRRSACVAAQRAVAGVAVPDLHPTECCWRCSSTVS